MSRVDLRRAARLGGWPLGPGVLAPLVGFLLAVGVAGCSRGTEGERSGGEAGAGERGAARPAGEALCPSAAATWVVDALPAGWEVALAGCREAHLVELEGAALPWLRWRVTEVYAPEELRAEALAAQAAGDVQRVAWIARVHAEAVASAPDVEEAWYRWVRRWRLTPSAALASEMESWLVERLQEAASAGEHQRVITLAEWLDTRELEGWEPTLRARLEGRTLAAEAALQVVAASLHQRHQERTEAEDAARGLYDPVAQVFVVREDTLAAREAGLGTWWFGRVQLTPQPGGPSLLEVLPQCRQLEEPCRLSFVDLVRSRVRYLAWTAEGVGDAQEATGR